MPNPRGRPWLTSLGHPLQSGGEKDACARGEAQSVRAAVTTVLHHSCDVGCEQYGVPRHQKMVTAREVEGHETHSASRGRSFHRRCAAEE